MAINVERLAEMKALQEQMKALQDEASEDLQTLIAELEQAIDGWGVHEVVPHLNHTLESYGFSCEYVGVFRDSVEREILRRINNSTAPEKTTELGQEAIEAIGNVPDINCDPQDVRKTIRVMVANGIITTFNPEGKKGRNSTYHLTPPPKSSEPVKGGKPKSE
jgi:hypothetical protein